LQFFRYISISASIDDTNTKNPAYERIGAMLIADDKTDVKLAIEKTWN